MAIVRYRQKQLARVVGAKSVGPCAPDVADRHSGYQVGGTSPFGLRHPMPIYAERTILDLPVIYINGGARGFLIAIDPREASAPSWAPRPSTSRSNEPSRRLPKVPGMQKPEPTFVDTVRRLARPPPADDRLQVADAVAEPRRGRDGARRRRRRTRR